MYFIIAEHETVRVSIQIPKANINYLIDDVTMNLI